MTLLSLFFLRNLWKYKLPSYQVKFICVLKLSIHLTERLTQQIYEVPNPVLQNYLQLQEPFFSFMSFG